jgi:structural maintenance of chromosome 1
LAVETQIEHSEKRAANARAIKEKVAKDEQRQSESLASLERGAEEITARMTEAAGRC